MEVLWSFEEQQTISRDEIIFSWAAPGGGPRLSWADRDMLAKGVT